MHKQVAHHKLLHSSSGMQLLLFQNGGPDVTDLVRLYVPPLGTYIRMAHWVGIEPLGLSSIISIIHTQRSLFFSHAHTRFVLCLRKGIYLWKRAISKTLRSAEWLKGAEWYNKKIRKQNYRKFKFFN